MSRTQQLLIASIVAIILIFASVIFNRDKAPGSNEPSTDEARMERIKALAIDWPTTPSYDAGFNALDPAYEVAQSSGSLFDPTDDYWGLPEDENGTHELVAGLCGGCHSLSLVMQQQASPQRWQELLVWMEEKQGMAPLPAEFEDEVLAYLSKHF